MRAEQTGISAFLDEQNRKMQEGNPEYVYHVKLQYPVVNHLATFLGREVASYTPTGDSQEEMPDGLMKLFQVFYNVSQAGKTDHKARFIGITDTQEGFVRMLPTRSHAELSLAEKRLLVKAAGELTKRVDEKRGQRFGTEGRLARINRIIHGR